MAAEKQPNILVIWGDDIGMWNISAYSHGMMGYRTPNIDRIAAEGIMFTDCYGEQSCTAGRSAFITGQSVFRTGLEQGGDAGSRYRPAGRGPHHRRVAEAAGLRHRSVRQEPPGRQGRIPAHQPRVRRVLRLPLPPERLRGAGTARLPPGKGLSQLQEKLSAPGACSAVMPTAASKTPAS